MILFDIFTTHSFGIGNSVHKLGNKKYISFDITNKTNKHEVFISLEDADKLRYHLSRVIQNEGFQGKEDINPTGE